MNVGLDIDNVISDFDKATLKLFLSEDKNKRGKGIVDKNAHYLKGMFDWSEEEVEQFLVENCEKTAPTLHLRKNAKKYIDALIERGHKIFLISHRAPPNFSNGQKVTEEWLKKKKINYHELILSSLPDKSKECKEKDIDVMFDDRFGQVMKMRAQGVNCVLVLTKFNQKEKNKAPFVSSWRELYNHVLALEKGEK